MDLEFHQLDLRYEGLRRRAPDREKRLLASLAQCGQQMPIAVVRGEDGAHAVVDGFKRIRALKRLKSDTVAALSWELGEADALVLARLMRISDGDDVFEQGWLLRELRSRFGLSQEELAQRFDKSTSWVCRRLSLVEQLPEEVQDSVRRGKLVPHAAMKFLVPLARANRAACLQLVAALGSQKATSRQIGALYNAWSRADPALRERLLADPWLFLRAREAAQSAEDSHEPPAQRALRTLDTIGAICRRAGKQLPQGFAHLLPSPECQQIRLCLAQTRRETHTLFHFIDQELTDAQPEPAHVHP
jgi:ParB family transcriptional regulator, chromosome partitioning protein